MTTKDPALTVFLLSVFALMSVSMIVDFLVTSRLARWLYFNRHDLWRELGCPGTKFFKGDSDNGYTSRTSALNRMYRMMPLRQYWRQFANSDAEGYIRIHRISRSISIALMILFGAGIFFGIERDKSRKHAPNKSKQTDTGQNATRPESEGGTKPQPESEERSR